MECVTLLHEAREAGLEVRADGDRLVVRGPRSAEGLARMLLARKAELWPMLADPCPLGVNIPLAIGETAPALREEHSSSIADGVTSLTDDTGVPESDSAQEEHQMPYIDATGTLVIPSESDPKYHWWAGGQTVAATLTELGASPDVRARYVPAWSAAGQAEHHG
jgi:hypothetical protein